MKTFRRALQRDAFIFTAELPLARDTSVSEAVQQAALLAEHVDGIQLAENQQGQAQISPVAMAALLLREGIDPIPCLICRDRNRIALQSDLLGLRASGVSSVILNEDRRLPAGKEHQAKAVFDVNGREFIAMANAMNEEATTKVESELIIGTSTTAGVPGPDRDFSSLLARAGAGARFLQTRPCFDIELLQNYMQHMVEEKITWNYAIIASIAPLPSAATARWLVKNIRGAIIPPEIIERLEKAADPEQEGIKICAELIREISEVPGISGVNLLSLNKPETTIAAINSADL